MLTWYGLLKVVHLLSVVVWIGGVIAITTVTWSLLRARDRATLSAWLPHTARYGQRIAAPASLLVLLSGIAMVVVGRLQPPGLWIQLGFFAILLHFVYGATVLRKQARTLVPLLVGPSTDDVRIAKAGKRMVASNAIYLLLMASAIAVMVLKPTL